MAEPNSSISNFKRFLIRIVIPLLLVIVAVGVVFDRFFEKEIIFGSEMSGAYKVNRILKETHPAEIPIFGSSRAEGGLIPDSLGPNYFNYGISSTKYEATLFFLEEECKKTKTTPWILLNLDLNGIKNGLGDIAAYVPNYDNPDVRKLFGRSNRFYYAIPLIKYYGRFETYTRNYLNYKMQGTQIYNKGAALEKNPLPQKEFDALVEKRKAEETWFIADSLLKAKLFGLIATHPNRNFVFVIAPYHPSFFERFKNMDDVQSLFSKLRSYNNVKILDFSSLALPDDMFMNTTHINYKGAIVFNRYLKDSLAAMGVH